MTTNESILTQTTEFSANGISVPGYLARPSDLTSAPAIILIQEWWGLNDHIKDIARRYAAEGFITAAVDLYDGVVTKDASEASHLMNGLDFPKALSRLTATIEYLRNLDGVTSIGVTGFCMGGVLSILTACQNKIEAVAPFYGMPDDLSAIANLDCPMLFIGGEKDQWITVEKMNNLKEALQTNNKIGEVRIYAGADHAFFNDTRPEVYNAGNANDAWAQVLAFFRENLK